MNPPGSLPQLVDPLPAGLAGDAACAQDRDAFLADFLTGLPQRDNSAIAKGLDILAGAASLETFPPGALLLTQGEPGNEAWLIHSGRVEVFRSGENRVLGVLESSDVLGELALTTGRPRAASARAAEPVTAWRIDRRDFEQALQATSGLASLLADKVYAQLARSFGRLQAQHLALQVADANQRALSFLFVAMMVLLSCYALIDGWVLTGFQVSADSSIRFWYSRVAEVSALAIFITLVRRTGMTFADMGIQWRGIGRSLGESLAITLVIMAIMFWSRVQSAPDIAAPLDVVDFGLLRWTNASYLLVAPMQEWLARGMFQASVERLLPWKRKGLAAIGIVSLVFAMFHLHISMSLSQAALATSIFWGWMFLRHRNLAGVSLSHFLLGTWSDLLGS
jgi:CRP-like cAMP-binding protein